MKKELREQMQNEIEEIAQENTNIETITHHSEKEAENTLGLNWSNISDVYFKDSETIGNITELREILEQKEYLAVITQVDGEPCLQLKHTYELSQRFNNS